MKNEGYAPIINARQVNPKAKAGLFGNTATMATSVTGMVIWNRHIPAITAAGFPVLRAMSGEDSSSAPTLIFIHPNRSEMMPPKVFQTKAAVASPNDTIVLFEHACPPAIPTRDRIINDIKRHIMMRKG